MRVDSVRSHMIVPVDELHCLVSDRVISAVNPLESKIADLRKVKHGSVLVRVVRDRLGESGHPKSGSLCDMEKPSTPAGIDLIGSSEPAIRAMYAECASETEKPPLAVDVAYLHARFQTLLWICQQG